IHGVQPGPQLFEGSAKLVNGILYGFVFTTIIMYIMGRFITPVFARVLTIPNRVLIPTILSFAVIGVFSSNYLFFDLWVALIIGVFGFIIRKLDFSLIGFLLAFI